jgi:PAS domain S-box-containing protein
MSEIDSLRLELENLKKENQKLKQGTSIDSCDTQMSLDMIDSIPVPVYLKDKEGVFRDCNKSFTQFCGKSKDQIIGQSTVQYSLDGNSVLDRYDGLILEKDLEKTYEASMIDIRGKFKSVIINKKTRIDDEGNVCGLVATITDISYQKKLEEELKSNEEKYRLMSEQSMLGLLIIQEGYVKWANLEFAKIAEESLTSIYSLPKNGFINYVHDADKVFVTDQAKRKQLGEKEVVSTYVFRLKTLYGNIRWCRLFSKTISYRGNFADLVSVIDISDQVQANEEMVKSEKRLREVIDMMPQFIFAMDTYGIIHLTNKSFRDYYGLNQIEGKLHISDCNQNAGKLLHFCKMVLDNNASLVETNVEFSGEQGKLSYKHLEVVPVDTFDVPTALGVAFDISQRKQYEDELLRMKMAIDSSLTGIVLLDIDCDIIYFNPMFSELWGYAKTDLTGQSLKTFWKYPEQIEKILDLLKSNLKWSGELVGIDAKGNDIHIQMNASIVIDAYGNQKYISCATQDISQRIKHEAEIERINLELEIKVQDRTSKLSVTLKELNAAKESIELALEKEKELHQLKTNFVNMVTHEYRTPLTIILSSTYLMNIVLKEAPNEKISRHLEKIQNSVKSMTSLLDDVILISKTDHHEERFVPSLIMMDTFIGDLIEEVKILDKRRHDINLELETEEIQIYSDSKLIKQIMINLILNAMKYSPDKSEIIIRLRDNQNYLEVAVQDLGIGIADDRKDSVFEPFVRGEENIGIIHGTGLGLTIAKRFSKVIQGNLFLEESSDKGSTFVLQLPRSKPSDIILNS